MICPNCNNQLREMPKSYTCDCGLIIWKKIAGKQLTLENINDLLQAKRTPMLHGFRSRKGRSFSAALVLQGNKVAFEFTDNTGEKYRNTGKESKGEMAPNNNKNSINVNVRSDNSGTVTLNITGQINYYTTVSYGLVPSRAAECLGCISAVKLIQHRLGGSINATTITFNLNSLDFARYILRETTPRDKEMRETVAYLWKLLRDFRVWQAQYQRGKRSRLKGSPQANKFPRGIFPWLKVDTQISGDAIQVELPNSPDVLAQFKASIWRVEQLESGTFQVPISGKSALDAWVGTVTNG